MPESTIGEIEGIEEQILGIVGEGERDPARILGKLVERGLPDSKIRVAFWFLIGAGRLDLTPTLQFELPNHSLQLAS